MTDKLSHQFTGLLTPSDMDFAFATSDRDARPVSRTARSVDPDERVGRTTYYSPSYIEPA